MAGFFDFHNSCILCIFVSKHPWALLGLKSVLCGVQSYTPDDLYDVMPNDQTLETF